MPYPYNSVAAEAPCVLFLGMMTVSDGHRGVNSLADMDRARLLASVITSLLANSSRYPSSAYTRMDEMFVLRFPRAPCYRRPIKTLHISKLIIWPLDD